MSRKQKNAKKKKNNKKSKKKLGPPPPFSRSTNFKGIELACEVPIDKLDEEQEKKMETLLKMASEYEICKRSKYAISYVQDRVNLYKYLQGFSWNVEKANNSLKQTVEWRVNFRPHTVYRRKSFLEYIEKHPKVKNFDFGFSYGHDKEGHPIAYLFPTEEHKVKPRNKDRMSFFFELSTFILEDLIRYNMPKGICKLTFVVDVRGLNFLKHARLIPGTLKKFAPHSEYYCELLKRALVVNASPLIMGMWKIITPFLYAETVAKYQFCRDTSILDKFIDKDQVIERLGGTCKFRYSLENHLKYVEETYDDIDSDEEIRIDSGGSVSTSPRTPRVDREEEEDEVEGEGEEVEEDVKSSPNDLEEEVEEDLVEEEEGEVEQTQVEEKEEEKVEKTQEEEKEEEKVEQKIEEEEKVEE